VQVHAIKAPSKEIPSDSLLINPTPDSASGIFSHSATEVQARNIYKVAVQAKCHVNLHQMRMIIIKIIAPKGAYCRSIALKLMFRAALRYFSDSERNELDKCDIPVDK
jgi:hypothetical protein